MSWFDGMWAGFGFETGGEVIFGFGKQTGMLFSLQDFTMSPTQTRWCLFQQRSATIGLGVGGSYGANFVVGYNADTPAEFEGASGAEFDFSIDLVLKGLDKYFRSLPEMVELAAIANKFNRSGMNAAKALESYEAKPDLIKAVVEQLFKNHGGIRGVLREEACLLSFPLMGGGLRLSVKAKAEETTILTFGTMPVKAN